MSSISDETYHLGEFEPRPDDDVVICRCEEITRGEIRRAVHAGMYTMNEVKRFLRAGMGLCQGQSCNKTVRAIIAQELGISPTETDVITARSPVRPVPMGVYGNDTFYPKFLGARGKGNSSGAQGSCLRRIRAQWQRSQTVRT